MTDHTAADVQNSVRTVECAKLGRQAPGLAQPPFEGELGQEIYNRVSAEAWKAWKDDMMIKVINEYRLNLAESEDYEALMQQMRAFLGLGTGKVLEVENPDRGKQA